MSRLVIKDSDSPFFRDSIELGWRIKTADGHHDVMWGNTRDDASLRRLLNDREWRQHLPVEIVDERVRTAGTEPLQPPAWWDEQSAEAREARS